MSMNTSDTPAGIQNMITALIWSGSTGLVIGLICASIVVNIGPDFLRASPLFTYLSLGIVFTLGSAMISGLFAISRGEPADAVAWARESQRR